MVFSKKRMTDRYLDPAGKGAPYFSDLKAWKKAEAERESKDRTRKAKENNPKGSMTQVTPGEWKTKNSIKCEK